MSKRVGSGRMDGKVQEQDEKEEEGKKEGIKVAGLKKVCR